MNKKIVFTGILDVNGKPIKEGDILRTKKNFRFVVYWNEYIRNFSIITVPCYNSMKKNPEIWEDILKEDNALKPDIIGFWELSVKNNIYSHPLELQDNEL